MTSGPDRRVHRGDTGDDNRGRTFLGERRTDFSPSCSGETRPPGSGGLVTFGVPRRCILPKTTLRGLAPPIGSRLSRSGSPSSPAWDAYSIPLRTLAPSSGTAPDPLHFAQRPSSSLP